MNGRRFISRWMLFAVATVMLMACATVPPSRINEERLGNLLLVDSKDDCGFFGKFKAHNKITPEIALLVDMGENALPIIQEAIETVPWDPCFSQKKARALEIVGGKAALPIFHTFLSKMPEDQRGFWEETYLCSAMSIYDLAPEDVPFTSILKFADNSPGFAPDSLNYEALKVCAESAAKTRHPDTLPVLEELLQALRASPALRGSFCVENAYDLVRNGDLEVSSPPDPSEEDQVVYALLRSGMPLIPKWRVYGTQFWDAARKGYWSRSGRRMDFRAGAAPMEEDAPRISFDVHISPDGRRAAVMLVQFLQPLAADGTLCLLVREGDRWKLHHTINLWRS